MRAAVLAGGTASRYGGRPKGLERVGGERILDRVAQAVREATREAPLLIANAAEAAEWRSDLRVRPDAIPGCGSLGGIYTAVTADEGPVLLVAWDMPFVSAELLRALVEGWQGQDVFLPESPGPRGVEPLCGVYAPSSSEAIKERLDAEDYRAIGFHDSVNLGVLPTDRVAGFGRPETLFFNVNTEEDLARAEELWRREHA